MIDVSLRWVPPGEAEMNVLTGTVAYSRWRPVPVTLPISASWLPTGIDEYAILVFLRCGHEKSHVGYGGDSCGILGVRTEVTVNVRRIYDRNVLRARVIMEAKEK